ncbi:MAG: hypothetical protein K2L17_13880, partial [Muribaculaceae bacterium]|nr:hypothetical protein [Muribaculaceae bacterium]
PPQLHNPTTPQPHNSTTQNKIPLKDLAEWRIFCNFAESFDERVFHSGERVPETFLLKKGNKLLFNI